MGYIFVDEKEKEYFLHEKKNNNGRIYFFLKEKREGFCGIPKGCVVVTNKRNGYPMIKRKTKVI